MVPFSLHADNPIIQVPLMRFPSQISNDGVPSVREIIQREFRAPTVDERLEMELKLKFQEDSNATSSDCSVYPSSSFVDNDIRIQTAFYTLTELNRKLAWADQIGFPASSQHTTKQDCDRKRLVQAAKGVSLFPAKDTKAISKEPPSSDDANEQDETDDGNKDNSSSPLQCGTYLIAHPLMTGYFTKSVIVLLDHTEEVKSEGESGGTYGLIINRLAMQPEIVESSIKQLDILRRNWEEKKALEKEETAVASGNTITTEKSIPQTESLSLPDTARPPSIKSSSQSIRRPISLLQAINADDLPETVQMAFGDAPIREGTLKSKH